MIITIGSSYNLLLIKVLLLLLNVIPIYIFSLIVFNVVLFPIVFPFIIISYVNSFNVIYWNNRMSQYEISLDIYWLTWSGYFKIGDTVVLVMGMRNSNILF